MLFKKNNTLTGVAFDIGTATVSAAIFEIKENDATPHVIKIIRKFFKSSPSADPAAFTTATISHIADILKDISLELKNNMPLLYVIGLSSIFYAGKTQHLEEKYSTARSISQSDVDGFIEKGKNMFLSDVKSDNTVLFETVLMKILLNGYNVERPQGKTATEVEFWVHCASISEELHSAISHLITTYRANAEIHFSTFPIACWSLLRTILFPEHSVMLVDIGGSTTEVTFLVDGVVIDVLPIPYGVENILVPLAEAEHIDMENALSLLKSYSAGMLASEVEARVRAVIKKELKSWEQFFERAWQEASRHTMNDIRMFFLGGGALVSEMKDAVVPPLLHPHVSRGLETSIMSPDAFRDKFSLSVEFDGPGDFGLISLILNVHK